MLHRATQTYFQTYHFRGNQEVQEKDENTSGDWRRVYDPNGSKICVKAVAVWDTVGALGIPSVSLVSRLGLSHSSKEYKFYNTNLSSIVKHAFQAMMDQLASIGVSFLDEAIEIAYEQNAQYYVREGSSQNSRMSRKEKQWAITPIYEKHRPVRPWALGKIYDSSIKVQDPIPPNASWSAGTPPSDRKPDDMRWIWEYCGPEDNAPKKAYMVEESLGPYERKLLLMNKGRNQTKRRKKRRKAPTGISTTTTRITEETARLSGTPTPLPYREKDRFREKIIVHEEELHDEYVDDPRGPPPPFREKIPRTPPPLVPPSPPIIDERRERMRYEKRENRTPEMHSPRSSNAGMRYREFDAVDREREGGFERPGGGREEFARRLV
ncbi:hypothetical protein M7I_2115 [Glarea lozoyensis 74030]|uniref:T6SS Phospholipase effector Tle1-like catalytic domain-containing protein n=1 Tax=Glarea lozoyensis (strain ATCC 74030 / MF5533) TaxID=1104152 RepID=H0EHX2_GLAL7|nr:hypothetical protein M7I_2115 [Glarea lozoyensis 74030]